MRDKYISIVKWKAFDEAKNRLSCWLSRQRISRSAGDTGELGFDPWVGKDSWRRKWQHTPVFLPRKSHGQKSPVGYSPWGCKESDTTEHGIKINLYFKKGGYYEDLTYQNKSKLAFHEQRGYHSFLYSSSLQEVHNKFLFI